MDFNDALDQSQPSPGARRAGIELLEQSNKLALVAWINAQSAVPSVKDRLTGGHITPDFDPRFGLVSHEVHRIVDAILEDLRQSQTMPVEKHRDLVLADLHPSLKNLACHDIQGCMGQLYERQVLGRVNVREIEQSFQQAMHLECGVIDARLHTLVT